MHILVAVLTLGVAAAALHGRQDPVPPLQPRDPGRANGKLVVGTATLSGVVSIAGSGVPARRARVTLSGTAGSEVGAPRYQVTDDQGRFAFSALPAGRYSLNASKPGYLAALYGQARPGRPGTPIQLADGQKFEAALQLTRGGVLTGTVLDENGEAVPGTQVRALRFVFLNGVRTLQPAGGGATDDRGVYRIYGLQPGDYVLAANPRNSGTPNVDALRSELESLRERAEALGNLPQPQRAGVVDRLAAMQAAVTSAEEDSSTGYAPVYYPGTTVSGQALPTTIGPGEERGGLDFQLQRVSVARVEGFVVNSTGHPAQNIQVMLSDLNQATPTLGSNAARVDADGRFRFANVAPGQYRLVARAVVGERGGGRGSGRMLLQGRGAVAAADQARLWAMLDITVDGRDLTNVALSLQPGVSISGRLTFQGTSTQPPSDLTRLRVTATPTEPGALREGPAAGGRVDPSGKFTIGGVVPGRYRLSVGGLAGGWVLESAVVDGQESLDFPFEVKSGQPVGSAVLTLTDRSSELAGALVDERGQPGPGYTLILYPADERYRLPQSRRIRTARTATDGRFVFTAVPAGDYRLAPVTDVEPGAWFDPAFLQQLDAAALRVSIAEGEKKVQNVRIAGTP